MLVSLRREYAHLVIAGSQLLLLFIGIRLGSRNGWLLCLTPMAAISILAWLSALARLRAIRDTPTSKIASAAQGYVELIGRGYPFVDSTQYSKFTALPCLWYRYTVKRQTSRNEWETVDSGESQDCFLIRDETGECVVDPDQAEILTQHCDKWQKDGNHYTEWKLIAQDRLYVIGQFRTQGGSSMEFDSKAELNTLLTEWKKDMPNLNKRFDLDNSGELNMQEWMLARSAAQREVTKMMREAQAQPDIHIIGQPRDGKLFLISNFTPDKLSRRFLFWSWAHLMIFFAAMAAIGWLMQSVNFH